MACKTCRTRKIKCDQTRPVCQNCQLRLSHCTYEGERRKRRWTDSGSANGSVGVGSAGFGGDILFLGDGQYPRAGSDGQPDQETAWPGRRASTTTTTTTTATWKTVPATNPDVAAAAGPGAAGAVATGESDRGSVPQNYALAPPSATMGQSPSTSTSSTTGAGGSVTRHLDDATICAHGLETPGRAVPSTLLDRILQGEEGDGDADGCETRHPAIWIRTSDGDEFTGPSSGISVISDVGLQWLRERVPDSETLCQTIQDIRGELLGHLRQPKCIPRGLPVTPRAPRRLDHVSPAQVLRYVDAYFASVQIVFPILDRAVFLSQLERFGTCAGGGGGNDAAMTRASWMALLSAVLASGCRAALSDETAEAFQASGREAWAFFQDALFYERPMAHGATDLAAVQALAVMTVFAQGLSSPQRLEYTLCSLAVRQAQAIGLNYQPSPAWQLSADEQRERSRVFWAIYCLDKTVALRCGRPCATSDSEISCRFPRGIRVSQPTAPSTASGDRGPSSSAAAMPVDGLSGMRGQQPLPASQPTKHPPSPPTYDFFLCFVRLARICGSITRDLYSAAAVCAPASALLPTMQRLLNDLEAWRTTIPSVIQPGRPLARMREVEGLSHVQVVILHSTYYYVLCAIYRRFSPLFTHHDETSRLAANPRMPEAYVQAARSMVLLTKHLDTESFTPGWLVFYYPLTALTTIFVHVITNPSDVSSSNDIALMEAVVGLFGRLEYVTSGEAAFTKTAEFVRQARRVVDRWHAARAPGGSILVSPGAEPPPMHPNDEKQQNVTNVLRDSSSPFGLMDTFMLSPGQTMAPRTDTHRDGEEAGQGAGASGEAGNGEGSSASFGSCNLLDPSLAGFLAPTPDELSTGSWLNSWSSASQVSPTAIRYF